MASREVHVKPWPMRKLHQSIITKEYDPQLEYSSEAIGKRMRTVRRSCFLIMAFSLACWLATEMILPRSSSSVPASGATTETGLIEALKVKDDAKIHAMLGDIYKARDDYDNTIHEYEAAAKLVDGADIEVKLGQAFQAKKDLVNAIPYYAKAISFKSEDPQVQDALVAGWEEALRLNHLAPENHTGLGQAYQFKGRYYEAEQEYKIALGLSASKSNPIALKLLAALPAFKARAIVSKHINTGVDWQERKQFDQALAEYKLALKADPRNDSIWMNIGTVYHAQGKLDDALSAYNQALKINAGNQKAQQGVRSASAERNNNIMERQYANGVALFKAGKYPEAVIAFQEVLKYSANQPVGHFSLGATYQTMKNFAGAKSEYQIAMGLDPKNADYTKALANLQPSPIIKACKRWR